MDIRVLRVAPPFLAGYGSVILLMATLSNMAAFMTFNGYGLTLPGMRDALGLSHTQEGTLVTSVSVSVITSGIITGLLSTRYQARYVVGLGGIFGGAAMIALGSSPNFLVALAAGAVAGFGMQMCITGSMGLVPAWFGARNRGLASGLASAGGAVSFIVLGALVPLLTDRNPDDGWRHSWYAVAAIGMAVGILSLALLRDLPGGLPRVRRQGSIWPMEVYRNPMVWLVALLAFFGAWSQVLYASFFGLFLEEEGIALSVSGRLWWIMGLLGIGSALFWGYLSDRLGRSKAFMMSGAVYTSGILVFWLVPVLAGFVISVVLVGVCLRAGFTLAAATMGDHAPPHLATAAFGMTAVGAGLGLSIAPPLGGSIADATGDLGWIFALAAAGSALGIVAAAFLRRPASAR